MIYYQKIVEEQGGHGGGHGGGYGGGGHGGGHGGQPEVIKIIKVSGEPAKLTEMMCNVLGRSIISHQSIYHNSCDWMPTIKYN